jgi:hypothetical protein
MVEILEAEMTREKLVELLRASGQYEFDEDIAVDSILAALADEQKGEVVIAEGKYDDMKEPVDLLYGWGLEGKTGKLIFREDK